MDTDIFPIVITRFMRVIHGLHGRGRAMTVGDVSIYLSAEARRAKEEGGGNLRPDRGGDKTDKTFVDIRCKLL